jgi:hypothetical protein
MGTFPTEDMELTSLLVVSDVGRSRIWYTGVLGASLFREYGGTSCVLQLLGKWLLLVTGGRADRGQADGDLRATG